MAVLAETASSPRGESPRLDRWTVVVYLALIFGAFLMVMPFLYMLSTSLKPANQVFIFPPRWIPDPIVWNNYVVAAGRLGLGPS